MAPSTGGVKPQGMRRPGIEAQPAIRQKQRLSGLARGAAGSGARRDAYALMGGFGAWCRCTSSIGRIRLLIRRRKRRRRIRPALRVGRVRPPVAVSWRVGAPIGICRRCRRRRRRVRTAWRTGRIGRRPAVRLIGWIRRFVASVRQTRLRRRLIGTSGQRQQRGGQTGCSGSPGGARLHETCRCTVRSIRSQHDLLVRAVFTPLVVMARLRFDSNCGNWIAGSCKTL